MVNQSAIVFHEIRNDNPGAARSLAGVIREMRGMLHHFVDSAEEETAKQMCLDSIRVVEEQVRGGSVLLFCFANLGLISFYTSLKRL